MTDPTHQGIIDFLMWALGGAGATAAALLGIWWKVESSQNKKIDQIKEQNTRQHELIHEKIDKVRDKVEEIWKHLVRRNGGRGL